MEQMNRPQPRTIMVEVAELGKEVIKFTFATPEDFEKWWQHDGVEEVPKFGEQMLGEDF